MFRYNCCSPTEKCWLGYWYKHSFMFHIYINKMINWSLYFYVFFTIFHNISFIINNALHIKLRCYIYDIFCAYWIKLYFIILPYYMIIIILLFFFRLFNSPTTPFSKFEEKKRQHTDKRKQSVKSIFRRSQGQMSYKQNCWF